ncbi:MAG: hypothetical protein LBR36_06860 [Bacteroidales bacterium]|jgi:hypothetical protein|nr:hypothetical protein [Bacteroidales bacterium]
MKQEKIVIAENKKHALKRLTKSTPTHHRQNGNNLIWLATAMQLPDYQALTPPPPMH